MGLLENRPWLIEKPLRAGIDASVEQVEMKLGVEKEIVVRMPPLSTKNVRVRIRNISPARPKVVY